MSYKVSSNIPCIRGQVIFRAYLKDPTKFKVVGRRSSNASDCSALLWRPLAASTLGPSSGKTFCLDQLNLKRLLRPRAGH